MTTNNNAAMKVTLFIGSLKTGGSERQIVYLARGLVRLGADVQLVTLLPGGTFWEMADETADLQLSALFKERPGNRLVRLALIAWAPFRLRSKIKHWRPNVLYSMLHLTNLFARLAMLGLRKKPFLVWGIRATVIQRDWRMTLPYSLCKPLSGSVPLFIANSQAGLDYYRQDGFEIKSGVVIHNGIDCERFRRVPERGQQLREQWHVSGDKILVGLVARLSSVKGHDYFIRMAARLYKADSRFRFVCVGSGPEAFQKKLEKESATLGVGDVVYFVGDVEDMPGVYSALDVVVSASLSEGFPNAVGEAMACGRPCVVTDVGDVRVLVGNAAIVVPPKEDAALANGVLQAVENSQSMGVAGRQRVESEFSIDAMVRKTSDILAGEACR